MNPKIFNIAYSKLIIWLTPNVLRQPKTLALLNALCAPVIWLYQLFLRNRTVNLYRLKITPQVVYLQKMVNDFYDRDLRRIKIVDSLQFNPLWIYRRVENKPVAVFKDSENKPAWIFTDGEAAQITVDFLVLVPRVIQFSVVEMGALLDGYKLAGKTYKIQLV